MHNGVVIDPVDGLESVTVALFIGSGSRDEDIAARGAAHLLEHLVTTTRRAAGNLTEFSDALGGRFGSITTPEFTSYAATLPKSHFAEGWRLLTDQFLYPDLSLKHICSEQSAILDEIEGVYSTPNRLIHEFALERIFGHHPLGYPARGKPNDIRLLTTASMECEHRRQLVSSIVPVVSGGIRPEEARAVFADSSFSGRVPIVDHVRPGGPAYSTNPTELRTKIAGSRSHILLSWVLTDRQPSDDSMLAVMNHLLGGSPLGLIQRAFAGWDGEYSCHTYRSIFSDCAVLSAYVACTPSAVDSSVQRIIETIDSAWQHKLRDQNALAKASCALKGSLSIGLESTRMRVNWIGRAMLEHSEGVLPAVASKAKALENVTTSMILGLRERLVGPHIAILEGAS